ncbi:hypothetical protein HD806DRAFT_523926 [Xylariaceae sp. AK1471]|nr:hypothetical protein HD806DRAFT_523926 [Xylariaceae sp. AK1471]
MASAPGAQQPDKLLSPWARRFGLTNSAGDPIFKRGPVQHSGIGPERTCSPRIDPVFYGDKPAILGTGIFPRPTDRDRLFYSDYLLRVQYEGMKPWQLGPLNNALRFSDRGYIPGGHERASASAFETDPTTHPGWIHQLLYRGELITPNEEAWLPFLRKDRWFNWDSVDPFLDGSPWSIDHPLVWDILSISLELVNRMLLALLADQNSFLHTLLFGLLDYWNDVATMLPRNLPAPFNNATALLSYDLYEKHRNTADPKLKGFMEFGARYTPDDHRMRLETLLEKQAWSFVDRPDAYATTSLRYEGLITLSIGSLKTLIEGDITLAERCICQFVLAAVVNANFHTVAHAITRSRMQRELNGYVIGMPEPFVDFGGTSEMGYAMEQGIFGGTIRDSHLGNFRPPLAMHYLNWPWPHHIRDFGLGYAGKQIVGHEDFSKGTLIEKILIPAEYTSKLLSETFWKDENIPRKSDNFFHRVSLFTSRTLNDPSQRLFNYITDVAIDDRRDQNQLTRSEKDMVQQWKEREALWDMLRTGWYQPQRSMWLATSWSNLAARQNISLFTEKHKTASLAACCDLADSLVEMVPWDGNTTRDMYTVALDRKWGLHYLGLLMMAAIPIRSKERTFPKTYIKITQLLSPSNMAEGKPDITYIRYEESGGGETCSASRFFDPLDRERTAITTFAQEDYLDLVLKIIGYLASKGAIVSRPWLDEIVRVERGLRQYWQTRSSAPRVQRIISWSGWWGFEVPEYDPGTFCKWNPAQNRWADLSFA